MTVKSESQGGVINLTPLKKSASFTISVEKVEVQPSKIYSRPLADLREAGEEEWSGEEEEEDQVEEVIIPGTDWESVNYVYKKFGCEDEVTGLAVSERFIIAQYFLEADIDVFDRKSLKLLHKLSGHEYGGQTVGLAGGILYSGSKDCSLRSWDLIGGRALCCVQDHRDYVQSLCVGEAAGLCVTGGAADHLVIIYDTDQSGALTCRHKLLGEIRIVVTLFLLFDN